MAFTYTVDNRPNVLGNKIMLTGTFANDGGSTGGDIALAGYLKKLDSATVNNNTAGAVEAEIDVAVPTTLTILCPANDDGKWSVIGNRA